MGIEPTAPIADVAIRSNEIEARGFGGIAIVHRMLGVADDRDLRREALVLRFRVGRDDMHVDPIAVLFDGRSRCLDALLREPLDAHAVEEEEAMIDAERSFEKACRVASRVMATTSWPIFRRSNS